MLFTASKLTRDSLWATWRHCLLIVAPPSEQAGVKRLHFTSGFSREGLGQLLWVWLGGPERHLLYKLLLVDAFLVSFESI